MNFFDIVITVVVLYCVIRGVFRGLIKELSSIIGVLAGFYAAYSYYPVVAKLLSRWIANAAYLNILSFIVIFAGILIAVSILGVVIKYLLNIAFLGWVDCICGAGFGFIKAILICSILLITFTTFLPADAPVIKNSLLAPYVTVISEKMAKVVSPDMKHQFEGKIERLKRSWAKKH